MDGDGEEWCSYDNIVSVLWLALYNPVCLCDWYFTSYSAMLWKDIDIPFELLLANSKIQWIYVELCYSAYGYFTLDKNVISSILILNAKLWVYQ